LIHYHWKITEPVGQQYILDFDLINHLLVASRFGSINFASHFDFGRSTFIISTSPKYL